MLLVLVLYICFYILTIINMCVYSIFDRSPGLTLIILINRYPLCLLRSEYIDTT